MFCNNCGSKNDDDAKFCSTCGKLIDNETNNMTGNNNQTEQNTIPTFQRIKIEETWKPKTLIKNQDIILVYVFLVIAFIILYFKIDNSTNAMDVVYIYYFPAILGITILASIKKFSNIKLYTIIYMLPCIGVCLQQIQVILISEVFLQVSFLVYALVLSMSIVSLIINVLTIIYFIRYKSTLKPKAIVLCGIYYILHILAGFLINSFSEGNIIEIIFIFANNDIIYYTLIILLLKRTKIISHKRRNNNGIL